mmetsp:Transcript_1164/g.2333  ORF Transcript_1164/g.2333 Transcript_1164/m.2333 type:complete len:216 (+) Transcript_1164:1014-1661(+)
MMSSSGSHRVQVGKSMYAASASPSPPTLSTPTFSIDTLGVLIYSFTDSTCSPSYNAFNASTTDALPLVALKIPPGNALSRPESSAPLPYAPAPPTVGIDDNALVGVGVANGGKVRYVGSYTVEEGMYTPPWSYRSSRASIVSAVASIGRERRYTFTQKYSPLRSSPRVQSLYSYWIGVGSPVVAHSRAAAAPNELRHPLIHRSGRCPSPPRRSNW